VTATWEAGARSPAAGPLTLSDEIKAAEAGPAAAPAWDASAETLRVSAMAAAREADLVQRAQCGDSAAWADLYDRHFPTLYRYSYARLRCREEAEDIAAQVFVDALRGIDRYEERGRPILAWLYRIAHNLIVERMRRDERARRLSATLSPNLDHHPGPEGCLDNLDLLDALARITPEQSEVIILRFLSQMTSKEVAAALGKTEPAVTSLQFRGMAALKRALGGSY
jgi:RNA polymerase sigma-70 factor (ECF subfamily)